MHFIIFWCLDTFFIIYEEAIQKDFLSQHLAMFFHGSQKFWSEFFLSARTHYRAVFFMDSLYSLVHRKKPENKKCKILDKRCFNVQRHHPNRQYHLLDLKSMQNPYVFGVFSGRVGDVADLDDVSAR